MKRVANASVVVLAFVWSVNTSLGKSVVHPVLRSAWMLTDPNQQLPPQPNTVAAEQSQLRRHFASVEEILLRATPRSLIVAAMRFERAIGRHLSGPERQRLLTVLYHRRGLQLARLRGYRKAGRFPINPDHSGPPRPIFVDAQGTACAVGYLMCSSGWRPQVEDIARTNTFVVVPDVHKGPLVAWVLQSGLTQEEAALIQPFYSPPSHYDGSLSHFMQTGLTIERAGVRYSNFTFSTNQVGATPVSPNDVQLATDISDIVNDGIWDDDFFYASGTNFIALHGNLGITEGYSGAEPPTSLSWRLGFDVTAINPTFAITAAFLSSTRWHNLTWAGYPWSSEPIELRDPDGILLDNAVIDTFGDAFASGYAEYKSTLTAHEVPLGDVTLGGAQYEDFFAWGSRDLLDASHSLEFEPTRSLHVETQLVLAGDAYSMDIIHEFTLAPIPEPSSFVLAALGLVGLVAWRRRRKRGALFGF